MNSQIDHYMSLPYRIEIFPDDQAGGFTALIPDLPGCISSADTVGEALASIDEAKRLWFEVALDQGDPVPEPRLPALDRAGGKFLVRAPRSLHRRLAQRAESEGVSLNQLVVSILSESMGRARRSLSSAQHFEIIMKASHIREFAWAQFASPTKRDVLPDWIAPLQITELVADFPDIVTDSLQR
jgi:antitoxin HicB